jgi:S-adenosylmethionine:tRNA ribosyltransferase-isomerase
MFDIHSIYTYDYDLPDERIAKFPVEPRDASKLLVYRNREITSTNFTSIADNLPKETLLIFNNTKVLHARLFFSTPTGATVEIFCLEPSQPVKDLKIDAERKNRVKWKCFIGNKKRWKDGDLRATFQIPDVGEIELTVSYISAEEDAHIVEFHWSNQKVIFADILEYFGSLPIPPYLNRESNEEDEESYQTMFAKHYGSVAAPTAALHFTSNVIEKCKGKGIQIGEVTLHVGAGTFKPVKTDSIEDHTMHSEFVSVSKETILLLLNNIGHIIPVGTTSMRTLESLYWLGVGLVKEETLTDIPQFVWKEMSTVTAQEALKSVLNHLDSIQQDSIEFKTSIMIHPGYVFKVCNGIITNFHQPKSTLMCLVSALIGVGEVKRVYDFALKNSFRFLSYGDSSLLLPKVGE